MFHLVFLPVTFSPGIPSPPPSIDVSNLRSLREVSETPHALWSMFSVPVVLFPICVWVTRPVSLSFTAIIHVQSFCVHKNSSSLRVTITLPSEPGQPSVMLTPVLLPTYFVFASLLDRTLSGRSKIWIKLLICTKKYNWQVLLIFSPY